MKNCKQCYFFNLQIPVCFCSLFAGIVLLLSVIIAGAVLFKDHMIAIFTTLGTIATSVMCYLAWKSIQVSQQQFAVLNADNVIAKLDWNGDLVMLILENTGAMPANEISVKFSQWFNEELNKLNDGIPDSTYVKSMIQTLRTNKRPLMGHTKIAFLLCKDKTRFYEVMRSRKTVRVSLVWRGGNGKKQRNIHDIDLVDEIILDADPMAKIASALHTKSSTGLATQAKRIADGICEPVAQKKV